MVQLDRIPEAVRSAYSVLQVSSEKTAADVYVLFWKPELEVETFYLNYRGDEIRELEARLLSLGFYDYKLDGLVGPRVMTALNRFQRQNGLPISGFPDHETLFLLCHASSENVYE
jgi:peptidoglycan hydrolase-like protein with peptidoglycan-binding domain